MELGYNNGTYFFVMESPDLKTTSSEEKKITKYIADDIVSFSVTEELGKIVRGSLQLRDNADVYSSLFRNGMRFDVTFGYKSWGQNAARLGINNVTNPSISGVRKGIRCMAQTPGGSGDEKGEKSYTLSFYGLEIINGKTRRVFATGTRYDVVSTLLDDLDVSQSDKVIDFDDQNEKVDTESPVRQNESSYNLLFRLAVQWKCFFHLGYAASGDRVAIFVDGTKIDGQNVAQAIKKIRREEATAREMYWNSGNNSNVRSFTWNQHVGESGQGDGFTLTYINGKPVFQQYNAGTNRVETWKLNEARINAELTKKAKARRLLPEITKKNLLGAQTFADIKWAFDPVSESTAPEGMGYTVNLNLHGDPTLVVPSRVIFRDGFPPQFKCERDPRTAVLSFVLRQTTQSMTKTGYATTAQVVDTYTLNGSFIAPQSQEEAQ